MKNTKKNEGDGVHYLWHLEQIGCINKNNELTEAWWSFLSERLPGNAKVAIIDNGCSLTHPNLQAEFGAILSPIEFSAHVNGTVYRDDDPNQDKSDRFDGIRTFFSQLGLGTEEEIDGYLGAGISNALRATILGYFSGQESPVALNLPSPSERFAAHGTACAGLVAGRPEFDNPKGIPRNPSALDYFGVNPFAKIIPVATSYSHAYWPMIMGLLYSAAQSPDVILIPRAVEEMQNPDVYSNHEGSGTGNEADPRDNGNLRDPERWAEKQLFEKLLGAISERIPVVVAAGNTGGTELEYPAKLVNAGASNLIVVGAVTANALRATYSSGYNPHAAGEDRHRVTVYAPSDDREETTADNFRLFDLAWRSRRLSLDRFEGAVSEQQAFRNFSPYGVFTLDIAGQYGYDSSSEADLDFREDRTDPELKKKLEYPETLPRALYTLFGGTSAASAIVAGLVSLLKATEEGKKLTGAGIKTLLEKSLIQTEAVTRTESITRQVKAQSTGKENDTEEVLFGLDLEVLLTNLGVEFSEQEPND